MIVDTIGHLSSIYQYAHVVYIGGAFRGALHNILEPAAYHLPVLFGKDSRNKKFKEAIDLVDLGVAREVETSEQLASSIEEMSNDTFMQSRKQGLVNYLTINSGASDKTLKVINTILIPKI